MKIAIQGHESRGKEVIQILESLGGINSMNHSGCYTNYFYYISSDDNTIAWTCIQPQHLGVFTLEEFEKEFPFKVGDKVRDCSDNEVGIITNLIDINNRLYYNVDFINSGQAFLLSEELKSYKEMKEKRNITLTLEKAKEWYKKGGELKEVALQAFTEKELNPLPRSWEEFCKQGNPIDSWRYNILIKYQVLFKLEQLRNCWWNGWEPEWNNCAKYAIKWDEDNLTVFTVRIIHSFLVFPTREMAEDFLKCFRDLIEKAGDLI